MNTAPPKIGRPVLLGIAVAAAVLSLLAACLALLTVSASEPAPGFATHMDVD